MTQSGHCDADMGAAVAARLVAIGDALYKDVPRGGLFRFKASAYGECFVKLARGYRRFDQPSGHIFRTGQRAAVFRLYGYG